MVYPQPVPQPQPSSATQPQTEPWTTKRLLAWMSDAFTKKGIDSPRLCAEILLGHVLRMDRLKLYTSADRPAEPAELDQLRALAARALKHEPVQYLTGEAWFFGLPLHVSPAVLVPRPCTELIVEEVLSWVARHSVPSAGQATTTNGHPQSEGESEPPPLVGDDLRKRNQQSAAARGGGLTIADVCTGSGCIAVGLAKRLPGARLVACDLSTDALAVARRNAERHEADARIDVRTGDLLSPLTDLLGTLDVLVANPPYIPDHEWNAVPDNVRLYEPTMALRAGRDGLQFVRPIIDGARGVLKPGGLLLIEIAACTAPDALALANTAGLRDACILNDLEGLPRVLRAFAP